MTRPRDQRQQWRRRGLDNGPKESTTTWSSLLSFLARLTLPMLLSSFSIPSACKHTSAPAVGDVHSVALYFMIYQLTHPLLFSRRRSHLPWQTPLSWSPFTKARHRNTAASVIVPKYTTPQTHCILCVLRRRLRLCRQFRGP